MNLVFFDFDDTLTLCDTTLLFGSRLSNQRSSRRKLLQLAFTLALLKARLTSNTGLKQTFARTFLRGLTMAEVQQHALDFCRNQLDMLTDEASVSALRQHVETGDSVYLLSANFACLLEPMVRHWSLAGTIATEAECKGDVFTGKISGTVCHGKEKLQRVIARFGAAAVKEAVAYGNRDDAPLLRAVKTGYLVKHHRPSSAFVRLRTINKLLSGNLSRSDLLCPRSIQSFADSIRSTTTTQS
jgi:HAD superfamily hydrolase (TIGR01490 family)